MNDRRLIRCNRHEWTAGYVACIHVVEEGKPVGWIKQPTKANKHLGTILSSKHPRNLVWANSDIKWGGHNVYICTPYALYRMKLGVPGPKGIQ